MQPTSLAAYDTVDLNARQLELLGLVNKFGPDTAENLAVKSSTAPGLWKRAIELENGGFIKRPGDTAPNPSGRSGLIIHITDQGKALLGVSS
jgi:hypothetical protein